MRKMIVFPFLFLLLAPLALLAGCGTPSVGVGVGIPHTPIGVGVGVPIWSREDFVYRPLAVESVPPGAEVYVNDALVGATPLTVQVPFVRSFWGNASGSSRVVVRKPGYAPAGRQLFPAAGGRIATIPRGNPVEKLEFILVPQ